MSRVRRFAAVLIFATALFLAVPATADDDGNWQGNDNRIVAPGPVDSTWDWLQDRWESLLGLLR